MAWLVDQFGMDRMLAAPVILPTAEFFPEPYSPTPESARNLLDRVCGFMGVEPDQIELGFYSQEAGDSAGLYHKTADAAKVWLETTDMDDPGPVIAVMAHEVAHHVLLGEERLTGDEEDHEPLTDLLTVFLGFGVFTTQAMLLESNYTSGNWHFSKWQRRGYLSFPVCGYALAIFAKNRQEAKPAWANYLRADVREVFQSGIRFLEETGMSGLTSEGPCPFYSFERPALASESEPTPTNEPTGHTEDGARWTDQEALAEDHEPVDLDPEPDMEEEAEADSHFARGAFLATQGNYEGAVVAFTEAIRADPEDGEPYLYRSISHRQLGRFREALSDAERAVQLDPDELECYRARAHSFFELADFEKTIADCDRILRQAPNEAEIYHLRGLAQAAGGDYDRAVNDYGKAIRHMPQVVAFYKDRATALERLGRLQEASRDRTEVTRRDPFSTQS